MFNFIATHWNIYFVVINWAASLGFWLFVNCRGY